MVRRRDQAAEPTAKASPVPWWVAPGFALAAVFTVPWVVFLGATLPGSVKVNDRLAWVGFDAALVVMLAVTAYLAWRGRPKVALAATALATMLAVDAWFDVNTSPAGIERQIALGLAVVEVGLAGVCLWIALHAATVVRRRLEDRARREAQRARRRERWIERHAWSPELRERRTWPRELVGWVREMPGRSTDRADFAPGSTDRAGRANASGDARGSDDHGPAGSDGHASQVRRRGQHLRTYLGYDHPPASPDLPE
jgi:hypothetical protein